jgi:Putative prokaryotic signal transducing protein
MAEKHVVVARFTMPMEAHMACGRLQADGIPAYVTGDISSSAFSGIGMVGAIEVHVPESAHERAEEVLAECMQEQQYTAGTEQRPQQETPIWVCSLCGDAVSVDETVCAACGTSREAVRPGASQDLRENRPASRLDLQPDKPVSTAPAHEPAFEMPSLENLNQGDVLAGRALKAALVTLLFSPIVCLWGALAFAVVLFVLIAFWFLLQLLLYPGELSPSSLRKVYLAVAIDVFVVLVFLSYFWQFYSRILF